MGYQQDDEDEDQTTPEAGSSDETGDEAAPAAEGPSDDDEDLDAASKADTPGPKQSPDDRSQAIRDYLQAQYGDAADTSDLEDARAAEKQGVARANMGHGLSQMIMAGSQAVGGPGASEADYQTALKQAHMPVQQAEEDRQNAIKDFLTGQQLGRQSDSDLQKQKLWQVENDANDPSSKKSQMAVHLFQSQFPDALKGWTDEEKGQLSAADIGKLAMPGQEKMAQLKMAQAMAQQRFDMVRQKQQFDQDQKDRGFAYSDLKDLKHDLDSETASGRSGLGVAQQKVDSANRLLTFADINPNSPDDMAALRASRTNPQVKAALVSKLNNMTPQQYNEVVSGLMTQVANGGGSLGQFEHLKASTANETLTNLKQYFGSTPHKAELGDFIVNNLQTLANERDTSQAVLDKHTATMKLKHQKAFQHPETADQAEAALSGFTQPPPAPQQSPTGSPGGGASAVAGGGVPSGVTLQDVQAEIARRKSGKVASK